MASEPLSWLALQAMVVKLSEVRKASGYLTDLGTSVGAELVQLDTLKSPKTIVVAGDFTKRDATSSARIHDTLIDVTIETVIPVGFAKAQYLAHCARRDITACLTSSATWLPTGVRSFKITAARLLQPREGSPVVIAQVDGTINLTETIDVPVL